MRFNCFPGDIGPRYNEILDRLRDNRIVDRVGERDASVWKSDAESQAQIRGSLGWIDLFPEMRKKLGTIGACVDDILREGFSDVVLLGMGGSSLCPELINRIFERPSGYPRFHVLDSTVPASIRALRDRLDVSSTFFIFASKSGSTIEPRSFFQYFFAEVEKEKGERASENFCAITDPGTGLDKLSTEHGFRWKFLNPSDIGGRFSALSLFGLVPAAIMGIDVSAFLIRAEFAAGLCRKSKDLSSNPGVALGALLGSGFLEGRDKLGLFLSPEIASFGLWIEQLVAESTGKEGKGVVPIIEAGVDDPAQYGSDRIFVSLHVAGSEGPDPASIQKLIEKGVPVLGFELDSPLGLAEQFFVWEFATAIAGAVIEINPFDQPNVQEAKDVAVRLLENPAAIAAAAAPGVRDGALTFFCHPPADGAAREVLSRQLALVGQGDYIAICAFIPESREVDRALAELTGILRNALSIPVTCGYGPRFLHSTGQLHKGGADNVVILQITCDDAEEIPVPGEKFTFALLKTAQSSGDYEALVTRNRRCLRAHIEEDVEGGLASLCAIMSDLLSRGR